jgi:chromosome segregation ATPase
MKKINKLILENFKFFNGVQEFNFEGKNVLIYGENGSGKSSIYWALYTFFQSSIKDNENIKKYFDTSHSENLVNRFIKDNENSSIKVEIINTDNNNLETMSISKDIFGTKKRHLQNLF